MVSPEWYLKSTSNVEISFIWRSKKLYCTVPYVQLPCSFPLLYSDSVLVCGLKFDIVLSNVSYFAAYRMLNTIRYAQHIKHSKVAQWNKQIMCISVASVWMCIADLFFHFNPDLSSLQLEKCHCDFFFLLLWYVLARSNNFSLTCMRLCFNISEGNRNIHKIYLTAVTWLEINIWYSHNLLLFKASKDNACCCETLCINLLFFDRVFQMQLFRCMLFYVDIFNFFCVEGCYRLTEGVLT